MDGQAVAAGAHSAVGPVLYAQIAGLSLALFYGGTLTALAFVTVVPAPRAQAFVRPDEVHALYGIRTGRTGSSGAPPTSSCSTTCWATAPSSSRYLKALGYDLSEVDQTGSNFGSEHAARHAVPDHDRDRTMVSDGLSVRNIDHSSTSFRVSQVSIGEQNYLGNHITYPARSVARRQRA